MNPVEEICAAELVYRMRPDGLLIGFPKAEFERTVGVDDVVVHPLLTTTSISTAQNRPGADRLCRLPLAARPLPRLPTADCPLPTAAAAPAAALDDDPSPRDPAEAPPPRLSAAGWLAFAVGLGVLLFAVAAFAAPPPHCPLPTAHCQPKATP